MAVGIIAEYNPFHAGHAYQIAEIKKIFPETEIVVLMSGSFSQRGEPTILNKFLRAKLAVEGGADLVLELPFTSSVRSAQDFARGALNIFEKLSVINYLAFGAETSDLNFLKSVSEINFEKNLKNFMSQGFSYAAAISKILADKTGRNEKIFKQPNTILALEYLRNLPKNIEPVLIQRVGAGYNDKTLQKFSAASAIRDEVYKNFPDWQNISVNNFVLDALKSEKISGLVREDFLFLPVLSKIISTPAEVIKNIFSMNEGLENLIFKAAKSAKNFQDLVNFISNKRYSAARVKRLLLYFLLDLTNKNVAEFDSLSYARILAFNSRGQILLKKISNLSDIILISKVAPHLKKSSKIQKKLAFDVKATNLYNILFDSRKNFFDDLKISPQKILSVFD